MNSEIRVLTPEETACVAGGLTAAQWQLAAAGAGCTLSFAALGTSAGTNILAWGAASATCGSFFAGLYNYYENHMPSTQSGSVSIEADENGTWTQIQTNNWNDGGSFETSFYELTYDDYSASVC